ncbi:hypothetical protein GQ54DRAFT_299779 [Martensiomyces pterosporus]|nr:hypothetical protein GQ54DRAFT_299779 [Martensiomyces pterosporus]
MFHLGGRVSGQAAYLAAATTTGRCRFASQLARASRKPSTVVSPFDKLDIRPVQRPDTAAYFMAKPKYADLVAGITQLTQQYPMKRYNKSNYKTGRWIKQDGMEAKLAIKMTENEYRTLVQRLCEAENVVVKDPEERGLVDMYLNQFRKGYSHVEVVSKKEEDMTEEERMELKEKRKRKKRNAKRGYKDDLGRWYAAGRRKEAAACAWIVPVNTPAAAEASKAAPASEAAEPTSAEPTSAEPTSAETASEKADPVDATAPEETPSPVFTNPGEILVNGKPLAEYFSRDTDRESVLFPFQVISKIGQYNAFVTVRGGGHTGQAEACQLAVARALYAVNRTTHANIRLAGLNRADGRVVERKKTGKPKARKSYTWVKR